MTADGMASGPGLRPDRVYLGWQYALIHPHPGPSPRRPTPPAREQLNPDWVAALRREQHRLDRPLKLSFGGALVLAAGLVSLGVLGLLNPSLCGLGTLLSLAGAVLAGRQIRHSERTVQARVATEERRVATIRSLQEARLFEWQAQHADQTRDWQLRRDAYERQKQWYAVSLATDVDRIDVAGGTLAGWSAVLTMIGMPRLQSGGELTVVDLTDGAVAQDLLAAARWAGITPAVWVLPDDLPRMDLSAGLSPAELADLLALAAGARAGDGDEPGSAGDLSRDNAILERVIGLLGQDATVAQINAALRVLGHIGDPYEDAHQGLLTKAQIDQLAAMYGRAAGPLVVERAWAMESQLRKLDSTGRDPGPGPRSRLRVVAMGQGAGVAGQAVLGTYVAAGLTPVIRRATGGVPWQHTLFLLGAERLRGDVLDRLTDACTVSRTGLVLAYRSIPAPVRERLGRGNAAVAFMRLGNAADARAASEQIGTEHRFVLSQLTATVGTSVTDSTGDSYTSTVGTADSLAETSSVTDTSGRSRGRGASRDSGFLPLGHHTRSRSSDSSQSTGYTDSAAVTSGVSESTAWGISTSRAAGDSESQARTVQRSREFLVEQHELQQLPPSAMIVTYSATDGRPVVLVDANPGIMGLPSATLAPVEEARRASADGAARTLAAPAISPPDQETSRAADVPSLSWRGGEGQPPPNLGPPPERLDWRRRPDE